VAHPRPGKGSSVTPQAEQFPFIEMEPYLGEATRLPYLPLTLTLQGRAVSVRGLLDTGSAVNVLPEVTS
jgi:hypothetical protein